MRKAKSKTVKTNGRPYNSPHISEGMKKWWKKRKAAQAATVGLIAPRTRLKPASERPRPDPIPSAHSSRISHLLADLHRQVTAIEDYVFSKAKK